MLRYMERSTIYYLKQKGWTNVQIAEFTGHHRDLEITVLGLPTAYWHELARKIVNESITLPSSLRLVIIGRERAVLKWRHYGKSMWSKKCSF